MPRTTPASSGTNGRSVATPLARAVARELGVDLAVVTGSGRGGRIMRADVEAAAAPEAPAPVPAAVAPAVADADEQEVPLSSMRRVVARRLVESMQSTPHFYLTTTVDAEELLGFRAELNRQLADRSEDLKVSVNDLIVKACAVLLAANPDLNVSFGGAK
jgi:pyruvate dehydrogenase E2 component (dihydrolipoamide acetyltransferase)